MLFFSFDGCILWTLNQLIYLLDKTSAAVYLSDLDSVTVQKKPPLKIKTYR